MKKIPTLFVRDPSNMKLVTREINPDTAWLLKSNATPTVKKDGINILVAVQNGYLFDVQKRRNPTREEKALGEEPGYIKADRDDPNDQHIFAAVNATDFNQWPDGAWPCEALGSKIQGGVESKVPIIEPFSWCPEIITEDIPIEYDAIKAYLEQHDIEGIVWHDMDSSECDMVKIKRRDFGLPWPPKRRWM